jgi:hypothetical protein
VSADDPLEFEDDGSAPMDDKAPLPLGAHGTWLALPDMGIARAGLGVVSAVDPGDSSLVHIYAVGGDDGGGALDTYEFLTVTVNAEDDHTVAASWAAGDPGSEFSVPRSQLGVAAADHTLASRVDDGDTFIYVYGGLDDGGMEDSTAEAALVLAGGQLGTWQALDPAQSRAGVVDIVANDFVYQIGGGPTAVNGAVGGEVCQTGLGGCMTDVAPIIRNWNSTGGGQLMTARYLADGTLESAFIFAAGGAGAGGALASTEQTVW